jgi:hypothetical protein
VDAECRSARKQNVLASRESAFTAVLVRLTASAVVRRRKKNKNKEGGRKAFFLFEIKINRDCNYR